jgi:hypothetical protein
MNRYMINIVCKAIVAGCVFRRFGLFKGLFGGVPRS